MSESGDRHVVVSTPTGVLVAVMDGLGHGNEAATAADVAVQTVKQCARDSLIRIIKSCQEKLLRTRGVALSLASIDANNSVMTWLGVGNVEGRLLRKNSATSPHRDVKMLLLRAGIVGQRLPPLYAASVSLELNDTLIFATDGIASGFLDKVIPNEPTEWTAERIMTQCSKGNDDALVLVARYIGKEHARNRN